MTVAMLLVLFIVSTSVVVGTRIRYSNSSFFQQLQPRLPKSCGPLQKQAIAALPLSCAGSSYQAPYKCVGEGEFGAVIGLTREGEFGGIKTMVAMKITKEAEKEQSLSAECNKLAYLERMGVTNTLKCLSYGADCKVHGHTSAIVSPYVSRNAYKTFQRELDHKWFTDETAMEKAVSETFKTVVAFLRAGVANRDQVHNIMYFKDGRVVFFDMGMAALAVESQEFGIAASVNFINFDATLFVRKTFGTIPKDWWANCRAVRLFKESVGWDPIRYENFDLTSLVRQIVVKELSNSNCKRYFPDAIEEFASEEQVHNADTRQSRASELEEIQRKLRETRAKISSLKAVEQELVVRQQELVKELTSAF